MPGTSSKYVGLFRLSFKTGTVYRGDLIALFLLRMMFPLVMILVWTAAYATTGITTIAGFTLFGLYSYFLTTAAIEALRSDMDGMINSDVRTGGIAVFLVRPITYIMNIAVADIARVAIGVLTLTLPLLIITVLFAHIALTAQLVAVFIVELVFAYLVSGLLGVLMGLLSVYFTNSNGMIGTMNTLMSFFGGVLVPLTFFPTFLSNVALFLPFQFMYYIPAATFSGAISISTALASLPIGAGWIIALFLLTKLSWRAAKKHINAVGV